MEETGHDVQPIKTVNVDDLMLLRSTHVCEILAVSYAYLRLLTKKYPLLKPIKIDEKKDGRPLLRYKLINVKKFIEQYNDY